MKRCAIIGGGISGLSAGYYLQKKSSNLQIDLYEAQSRLGGVICSEQADECLIEGGPDSFLTIKKAAARLCQEIGLGDALVGSNDATRRTYIFHEGKLKPLPDGFFLMVPTRLLPFLTTDLISWPGKFDALTDLFSSPEEQDCTVADFIGRRFGQEILSQIAEPMISGIYGADVRELSLQSALPQIWELQKRGSMIWNLLHMRREAGALESLFTTLAGGMESLVVALRGKCSRVNWMLSHPVKRVEKEKGIWKIGTQTYDALLISTSVLPEIEIRRGKELRSLVASIRRNSAVVIVLCFKDLFREGFGWLVPEQERQSVLACTYVSNKFPGRSPKDRFLIRLFIGGGHANQWLDRTDSELLREVLKELERVAGITQTPLFHRIFRWREAMPEYAVGHAEKIASIEQLIREEANLFMTGQIFSGVGIPDCIAHSERVVDQMLERFGEVK